jgi:predicted lipid-binding transport protein (Tim44 family)
MPYINGTYYTERQIEEIRDQASAEQFERFLISGAIGALTGSAIIGGLLGGSFLGGFLGDAFEGTDDSIF